MSDAIQLQNENDYRRTVEIEAELIRETGYTSPPRERYVTFPVPELADAIRARLREEGISFQ